MKFEEVRTEYIGFENKLWHAWISFRWTKGIPVLGVTQHENKKDICAFGCTEKEARRKLKTAVRKYLKKLDQQVSAFHTEVGVPKLPKDLL